MYCPLRPEGFEQPKPMLEGARAMLRTCQMSTNCVA